MFRKISLFLVVIAVLTIAVAPILAQGSASLSVSKGANVTEAEVGQTITYTYWVTNTGNVDLVVVAVDDKLGDVPLIPTGSGTFGSFGTFPILILEPNGTAGAILTHTVTASDLPGPLVNSVAAAGTLVGTGSFPVIDIASVSIDIKAQMSIIYLPIVFR